MRDFINDFGFVSVFAVATICGFGAIVVSVAEMALLMGIG